MAIPVIQCRSLSKRYRLGTLGAATLRDEIQNWWARLRGTTAPGDAAGDYWALRDVSFDIEDGDIVGIIGRNGAGKSTLLKILSRITEPTSGEARIRGRVASLLEVGTGFHPELSGRENIYLNGTILGMTKAEVRKKFDEIVDFSGIEKFIDTPVKRYSSGMYVRLAFAVAAHLDPEIMIVDEVLAVGDGEFQKKCLGKMRSIHESGRTVLFVSHQLNMITSLCTRGIVLKDGSVYFDGTADQAVLRYQTAMGRTATGALDIDATGRRVGDERACLHRAWLATITGQPCDSFSLDQPIVINIEYTVNVTAQRALFPNVHVMDDRGSHVFATAADTNRPGRWIARCTIPAPLLNSGTYTVGVALTAMTPAIEVVFWEPDALTVRVSEPFTDESEGKRCGYMGDWPGPVRPRCSWVVETASDTS